MKKRRLILLTVALGVIATITVVLALRSPSEPLYQGRPVTAWARDMNNPDPLVRSNAAVALRAVGPNAVPFLVRSLNRKDSVLKKPFLSVARKLPLWFRRSFIRTFKPFDPANDRLAAANALTAFGTNAPVAPLVRALHDPEKQIASQAATALGKIGKRAVPDLIRALNDSDGYVRSMACYALSTMGTEAADAAPALVQRLTDKEVNIPPQAAYALTRIGVPGVEALAGTLKDPDERIRIRSIRALGDMRIQARDAAPALMEATKDASLTVRQNAVEALGNVWPFSEASVSVLLAALKDEDAQVRLKAAQALSHAGRFRELQVPGLVKALDDHDAHVRGTAAQTLALAGPTAKSAVPELTELLNDKSEFVRTNAAEALKQIQGTTALK